MTRIGFVTSVQLNDDTTGLNKSRAKTAARTTRTVTAAGKTRVVYAHGADGVALTGQVSNSILERARAIAQKRAAVAFSPETLEIAKEADKVGGVLIRGRNRSAR
jgi:hypothetical protein